MTEKEIPILGLFLANFKVIKFELNQISLHHHYTVNDIFEFSISVQKYMKQNNRAECKPNIEMGTMAGNGPGIIVLLTAPPLLS